MEARRTIELEFAEADAPISPGSKHLRSYWEVPAQTRAECDQLILVAIFDDFPKTKRCYFFVLEYFGAVSLADRLQARE